VALYSGFTPTIYAATADAGTGDGSSEANAMDLPTALSTATAGAIVGVLPGVYSGAPSGIADTPIFRPSNAGTSGNPIRIVAKYPAVYLSGVAANADRSEFASSAPADLITGPSDNNPVLGSLQTHVHFYGFYADWVTAPPRPSNGVFLVQANGVQFHQCVVDQGDATGTVNDNWNSIHCNDADDLIIKNCTFNGGTWGGNQNHAAITTYGCRSSLIEHNTFDGVYTAIFIKGSSDGATHWNSGTIRYNKILDAQYSGIEVAEIHTAEDVDITQNLLIRCDFGGIVFDSSGNPALNDPINVLNNTLVDCIGRGGVNSETTSPASTIINNIFFLSASNAAHMIDFGANSIGSLGTVDYNNYFETGATATFHASGATSTGLDAWKVATSKDANSLSETPSFENAGADDYRLAVGSTSRTASDTDGPIGCYITGSETIGVETEGAAVGARYRTRRFRLRAA
jgi:hypothetical protein